MQQLIARLTDLIALHPGLAIVVVFLLAASESIVVIGALVPGTAILLALSALIGLGRLPLWPILVAAVLGAVAGDGLSYWIGRRNGERIARVWPFTRWPRLIPEGQAFFERHGGKSILIARFTPGVRAVVPVLAGSSGMPPGRFFAANVTSALIWAPTHILPGAAAGLGLGVAGHMSLRLAALALVLAVTAAVAVLGLRLLVGTALPFLDRLRAAVAARLRARPGTRIRRMALALIDPDEELRPVILIGLPLAAMTAAFISLAEDVADQGGLARADAAISHALIGLRTDPGDAAMIFITAFGDWPVVVVTAAALVLWLLWRRDWRQALGVAAIVAMSSAVTSALKAGFAVPRPSDLYGGVQAFSFPSGHATSAMTLLGLLAWFAWRGTPRPWSGVLLAALAALAALIAVSRLYLAAHWPSDVLGGLMLGAMLVLIFALAFRRRAPARAGPGVALALAVFAGFGAAYSLHTMPAAALRYARVTPEPVALSRAGWLADGWRELPQARTDLAGENEEPITLQWAGGVRELEARLAGEGWVAATPLTLSTLARYLTVTPPEALPVIPRLADGRRPVLTLIRPEPGGREILFAWTSGFAVDGVAVLIAAALHEDVTHPLSFLTMSDATDAVAAPALTGADAALRGAGGRAVTLAPLWPS